MEDILVMKAFIMTSPFMSCKIQAHAAALPIRSLSFFLAAYFHNYVTKITETINEIKIL